jgi:hypothetical protein
VTVTLIVRGALVAFIAWSLWLPLGDIFRYPDRLSVLPNLQTDASSYHAIASDLAASASLDALPARHPPGWVGLLGLVYMVSGPSYVAGKTISWLALVLTVVGCGILARRIYGHEADSNRARRRWRPLPEAGAIASALCASSPAMRGYVGTLQYEVLTGALLVVVLVLAVRTIDVPDGSSRWRRAIATGLAGGALVLTRETFAVIVPIVAFWMGARIGRASPPRSALAVTAIVMSVAAAPATAWSIVQSVRHRTLITISEKGPMVVELGNNPLANGTYNAPLVGIGQPTGLAFVRAFPERSLVLAGRKMLYFWGVLRDGWNVPRPAAVWLWRATTGLVPLDVFAALARGGWLLLLFAASLSMLGRDGLRDWWGLPATVIASMLVHVAVLSSHRFAVPLLPIVFVLGSGPLTAAIRAAWPNVRTRAVAVALAVLLAVVLLMQAQAWPLSIAHAAVDLDGQAADNVADPVAGIPVRLADARRKERPVVLLTDEYLPRGPLRVDVGMRLASAVTGPVAVARITLVELDGHVACHRDVPADMLSGERFTTVAVLCRLTQDTPATLAVFTLGVADLAIDQVRLTWLPGAGVPPRGSSPATR